MCRLRITLQKIYICFIILLCQNTLDSLAAPSSGSKQDEKCEGPVGDILHDLRTSMENSDLLNGRNARAYVIPMTDAHQNEYISDRDNRLQYISQFSGSAGDAVVTNDDAVLWTDSRYHLQAEQELDSNCWTLMKKGLSNVPTLTEWLINTLPTNSTVGVDGFLITAKDFRQMDTELKENGHELISISANLVDSIWISRPAPSFSSIIPLDIQYSGKTSSAKTTELMEAIRKVGAESIVITTLDDIAWLLNLRGSDIEYNPVFFSYLLLSPVKSYIFIDKNKTDNAAVQSHMETEMINLDLRNYDEILDGVSEMVNTTEGAIIVSSSISHTIASVIPIERQIENNIVASMKTVKNAVEVLNMEKAHIRDGLALIQYLHWLNTTIDSRNITELSGAAKLSQFRAQQENFRGLSFEVISAVGENAAMAHYKPSNVSDKQITREQMYLVDSGGHYYDGTTDVTRTVHFGVPSYEEKMCYTRVLKGFIALTTSVFPKTAPLSYLDHMARRSLWQAGLNYGHGTGHGVGMYLYVHEYPPHIGSTATDTIQANVFTSNEPGYYKDGHFGIRIEDVIQVVESEIDSAFDGDGGLTFKSITYAPLAMTLIDIDLLTQEEVDFLNTYNKRVLETIGPLLLKYRLMDTHQWLVQETKTVSKL